MVASSQGQLTDHRIIRTVKFSVNYYNAECMSLYIVTCQEWTLMSAMDLGVTALCQGKFINYSKCATLLGNVDSGETVHGWGQEYIGILT